MERTITRCYGNLELVVTVYLDPCHLPSAGLTSHSSSHRPPTVYLQMRQMDLREVWWILNQGIPGSFVYLLSGTVSTLKQNMSLKAPSDHWTLVTANTKTPSQNYVTAMQTAL